ncbi:MAG TPA: AMP-binding protein, partial [bacterium]|nr:AMP-binding protein [bacterium]
AETWPERPSLGMVDGPVLTYALLQEKVQLLSAQLHEHGILAGDRVAILSENKPQWGIAYLAITTMGAVVVPILPDFTTAEVQHIIRHSGSKAIFVSEKLYSKVEDEFDSSLRTIFLIDDFSLVPLATEKDRLKDFITQGSIGLDRLKEAALRLAGRARQVGEEDLASIIYTSGTTGNSKGVMLTHKNLVSDAIATKQIVRLNETDRLVSILPLSHAYECTLGFILVLYCGASVYYIDKPPTARALMPALEKIKPTIMCSVPLVIEKIYKTKVLPQFTQKRLMRGLYKTPFMRRTLNRAAGKKLLRFFGGELHDFCIGGALLAADVEQFLREARFPYAIGYGLTETAPLIAGTDSRITVLRSTGMPLPGVEIRIDNPHPRNGEGEILVRGPMVMKGYYRDPERTSAVLSADGWFRTGDLGAFDEKGYLYIKGRVKNMIVGASGENIYPEEIEEAINEHPDVLESLVFEQGGQILARVYLNYEELDHEFSSRNLSDTEIQEEIGRRLEEIRREVNSRVKVFSRINKIIEQKEPFEKTPTLKIKRYLYV